MLINNNLQNKLNTQLCVNTLKWKMMKFPTEPFGEIGDQNTDFYFYYINIA